VSATDAFDLLVLGDCNPDLILTDDELVPEFGQAERLVEQAELTVGGSGAIMACGAALLGTSTALAAVVGEDLFGRFMRDALSERGVDTSGLIVDPALRTGLTVVLARPDDRAILTFPGAIAELRSAIVDPELLGRSRHVHVSAFFLQRALVPGLRELLAAARARGATTSLDPNWDPSGSWDGGLLELLPHIDVLLPNEAEACAIAGTPSPEEAAARLALDGPLVVVKMGAQGSLAVSAGEPPTRVPAFEVADAVDAVGAGDSFDAGFLAGWLAGRGVEGALALGCACGALSMRGPGGTPAQGTLKQAESLMQRAGTAPRSR
jgi:sugar/nucleoside kinase (ribokinase family)